MAELANPAPGLVTRQLTVADARLSYPLMMLQRPSLTLGRWRAMLRAADRSRSRMVIGVLNRSGCLLAIAEVRNGEIELLAEPPPLLGDAARLVAEVSARLCASPVPFV